MTLAIDTSMRGEREGQDAASTNRSHYPERKRVSTFGWSRRGAGVLLAALICAVLAGSGFDSSASAQGTDADYDLDDDGLIEVTTEAQLSAIRWDLDGNGAVDHSANEASYSTAFPSAPQGLGCPAPRCTGYELAETSV